MILSVILMNCIGVKNDMLVYVLYNCFKLKKIVLIGCNFIMDVGIFVLVCNCNVFEMVWIFFKNILEIVVINLVKNNFKVRELYVYFIVVI